MNIALKIEVFPGFGNEMLYKLKKILTKNMPAVPASLESKST
jgi:hypothetical protein